MVNLTRHVISSRLIGLMIRSAPNVKMYIVSVVWSDDSEGIIYRSFQEFQKFHGHLKKKFPLLNPLKKSERVIPKFRARAIKSKLQQNGSRKSVHRMKFLDDYCSELLQCNASVCQSSEVNLFFTCKDQDLQPDFTKNSIMVLPSGDLSSWQGGGVTDVHRPHSGSVTSPFVTQTYRCVAAYETKDTKNRPFNVVHDEVLEVLIKDPAGWWLVENQHKRLAWFPAPYLQMFEEDSNDDDDHRDMEDALLEGGTTLYIAVRTYTSQKADEVSVPIGSVVSVLRMSKDGWWFVRHNDKAGFIPSMYLKPYSNPTACLHSLQRKLHSSTLNLASLSLREAQAGGSAMPSLSEHRELEGDNQVQTPGQREMMSRLRKARSLELLSEADHPGSRGVRSLSLDEYASLPGENARNAQAPPRRPRGYSATSTASGISATDSPNRLSNRSTSTTASSGSGSSGSTRAALGVAPAVPTRPKAQEILTRCTTMTRKAALSRTHIQSR